MPSGVDKMVVDFKRVDDSTPVLYGKHDSRPGWNYGHYIYSLPPDSTTRNVTTGHDQYFLIKGNDSDNSSKANLTVYFNCNIVGATPLPMPGGSTTFDLAASLSARYSVYVPPGVTDLTITATPFVSGSQMKVCEPDGVTCTTITTNPHTYSDPSPTPGCWEITLGNGSGSNWHVTLAASITGPTGDLGAAEATEGSGTMSAELQVGE